MSSILTIHRPGGQGQVEPSVELPYSMYNGMVSTLPCVDFLAGGADGQGRGWAEGVLGEADRQPGLDKSTRLSRKRWNQGKWTEPWPKQEDTGQIAELGFKKVSD
jgi:hypothetical protein